MDNYAQEESVWLVSYKKSYGSNYVSNSEVLDELLCFGWIDGIKRKLDANRTMQLISPRRAKHWSKTYKDRAQKLIKQNRIHQSGLDSIEESKKSGLWNFMDDVDRLIKPADLNVALSAVPEAEVFFDSINDSSKRFVLRWLKLAKTQATRNNRIEKLVELAKRGEKLSGS